MIGWGPVSFGGDLVPVKGRIHGKRVTMGSEQWKSQTGCPSPGILYLGDKSSLTDWRTTGTDRKVGKAWTSHMRTMQVLAAPRQGREVCSSGCPVSCDHLNGILLSHKKNEILPNTAIWMDPDNITLAEISQTEEDKYCMISYVESLKKRKQMYIAKEKQIQKTN